MGELLGDALRQPELEAGTYRQIRNLIAVLPETQDLGPVSTH
jgi:hypothetical protein